MNQFLVPQFIDVEDKIIGPITTRQFVMVLVALFLTFIFYKLFSFWLFVAVGLLNSGLFSVLAFVKINGRPIHFFLLNFAQTFKRPSLRVWNKESYVANVQEVKSEIKIKQTPKTHKEAVTGSRLRDLALVVNTGGVYESE